MTVQIDLNADMGESFGNWSMGDDDALLDIVTSANIACGFHAGDPMVMDRTIRAAVRRGVGIGAHPGFDDLQGFGRRRVLGLSSDEIRTLLLYQIGALQAIARSNGAAVRHVKLHGALGNMASECADLAADFVDAVALADDQLIVVAMAATQLERAVRAAGMNIAVEVYADRAYNDDGTLVDRKLPGAVIHDSEAAADRVLQILDRSAIRSIHNISIPVDPETVCVHGDSPGAVKMAETIRLRLENAGVRVRTLPAYRSPVVASGSGTDLPALLFG